MYRIGFAPVYSMNPDAALFSIEQLETLPGHNCPCGVARRAFWEMPGSPASVHLVEISLNAKTHYHKRMTEIYVVLEGEGMMELDGQLFPVKPLTAIQIKPG